MSGLADRLVTAATRAIVNAPHDSHDVPDYDVAGRQAATAVLMTLAESGQVAWAESLAGLAEVIEKGEQG